ncbi:HalOD1 output domain-containing protein [Halorubrum yunnanense]|uniref:HalOD1 output domain-containing protein n=1 Tax=Halorubrum yunnanense TaxID=1526162 RepID=A0ABD5Y9V7_9EURY|nr:HalOD1 output domain-containing protein [Halorubrum yunnanense]
MNIKTNWHEDAPVHNVNLDDATDRSASYAVVTSIADLTDRDPDDLEPLWDSVDPDALDTFVAHANESSTPYRLTFRYEGYAVEIAENGRLQLTPGGEAVSTASV